MSNQKQLSDRLHKALYSMFIAAQLAEKKELTTSELYKYGSEFKGVTLLKNKEDTAALLSEFRDRGWVEVTEKDRVNGYKNKISDQGWDILEPAGAPDEIKAVTDDK